jgi:Flp pilus assembly protein TadG
MRVTLGERFVRSVTGVEASMPSWRAVIGPARSRGQAMVEFAFVFILFLGTVMAIIEGGRLMFAYFALANASAEGARIGSVAGTSDTAILAAVNETLKYATGTSLTNVSGTTAPGSCTAANTICICRHTNAALDTCLTAANAKRGDVVDVRVTYQFMPLGGNPSPDCGYAGWCLTPLLTRASVQMTGGGSSRIQ